MRRWITAIAGAALVVFATMAALNLALVTSARAATPPNPSTEQAPRVVQVACGFHVLAVYVAVDAATLEPLYPLNNDPIEMAVMPAPCPEGGLR